MLADLHVHTTYSHQTIFFYDGVDPPEEMVRAAKRRGLEAVAITDHDSCAGIERAREEGRRIGVVVIPGCEVSSRQGHILAYGIEEQIPPGLSVEETVERIHEAGGIAVAAHPFSGFGVSLMFDVLDAPFDAVEVWNASVMDWWQNALAEKLAARLGVPGTAGSDAHSVEMVGYGVVDLPEGDADDLIEAIRKGDMRVVRREIIPLTVRARWLRRRAEMNREYTREYLRSTRKTTPIAFLYSFLLRLPPFFDYVYIPPAALFLYAMRRLSKKKYKELSSILRELAGQQPI